MITLSADSPPKPRSAAGTPECSLPHQHSGDISYPLLAPLPLAAVTHGSQTNPLAPVPFRPLSKDAARFFNLSGIRCRWSTPLVQDPAKSSGGISKAFDWFLSLFVHDEQLSMENHEACPENFSTRSVN